MRRKKQYLPALLLLLGLNLSGQLQVMDSILADPSLTGTSFSFCFADAHTGEIVFSYDASRNLAPASVMKLFPTSAALSLLGPDYRFSTRIWLTGKYDRERGVLNGNVIIAGNGDPALGSPYFTAHYGNIISLWANALQQAGVKHIRGRVAAAASPYDSTPLPGGWEWGDLGYNYGAGVHDLNINDNVYNIYISGRAEGEPALIDSVQSLGNDLEFTNQLNSSGHSEQAELFVSPYSTRVLIRGSVPTDSSIVFRASLPDPPLALVRVLDETLRQSGVQIDGEPSASRAAPPEAESLLLHLTPSPSLREIVRVTNHESVNMYAEALSKHLGLVILGEGSYHAGYSVISEFLNIAGCDTRQAIMLDASGLSSNNNISSLMTVRLLVHMYNSPVAEPFISSLPAGALSGTMKNYFRQEVFMNRVVAKTGTITSAKSFAGYITTNSGREIAFTTLANGFTVSSRKITDIMERVVKEIVLAF